MPLYKETKPTSFPKADFNSPKEDFIKNSLLCMLLFQRGCHLVWNNLLILGFKSVYGILNFSGAISKADLTADSAFSFPFIPMWLGIQYIRISFEFYIEFNLLRSLMIRRSFLFFSDSKPESESENMIKFL